MTTFDFGLMTWAALTSAAALRADLVCRRIPNYITVPGLLLGLVFHLPGGPVLWTYSAVAAGTWAVGGMGGGDLKLWLALLWLLGPAAPWWAFPIALAGSALAESAFRRVRGRNLHGPAPGAVRAALFVALTLGARAAGL